MSRGPIILAYRSRRGRTPQRESLYSIIDEYRVQCSDLTKAERRIFHKARYHDYNPPFAANEECYRYGVEPDDGEYTANKGGSPWVDIGYHTCADCEPLPPGHPLRNGHLTREQWNAYLADHPEEAF